MSDILHAIGGVMLLGVPISLIVSLTGMSDPRFKSDPLGVWFLCYLAYFLFAAVAFVGVVGVAMLLGAFR